VTTREVQQAYVGYVYGDSTCGQRALYERGPDRHPGLQRQQQLLHRLARCSWPARRCRGAAECVLALGFEQMEPGALRQVDDRANPLERFANVMNEVRASPRGPRARRCSAAPGREYMEVRHQAETFAKHLGQGPPARRRNPLALFRQTVVT
jgi:sterol carrier protein 2